MTVSARKFTPEVLLSAPRRGPALANKDGSLALFSLSTYSFQSHSKTSEIRVLDIETGQSRLLLSDLGASEPTWLGKNSLVLFLKGGEKGTTTLMVIDAGASDPSPRAITTFHGAVSNLKLKHLDDDTIALTVSGLATPDGELYNSSQEKKPYSSAKIYSKLYVRHWDSWNTENKSTIWYATLKVHKHKDDLSFTATPLKNVLKSSKAPLETPIPPFGGTGDYDISKTGIVFVALDPKLSPANYTKSDLYYIPIRTFTEDSLPSPQLIKTGNLKGYSASPVFSPDGNSVAFTRMKNVQYESDKTRLLLIPDITDASNVQEFFETDDGVGGWDLKPDTIVFSEDGKELFVTAEEKGRGKVFRLPSSPRHANELPVALTNERTVSNLQVLPKNRLLLSSTSLLDNSVYSIINLAESSNQSIISSNAKNGQVFGLHQDQVEEIWYTGGGDYKVHAWVVKPSTFDASKKYPLAYLIHGGPQGAWLDNWSTRWNPAVFAEQGYVVVTPNFTGSSGYGMDFQNGIRNDWGGRPYDDLVAGFDYIETNLPYVDTSRAVALGASYGGYMVNWIQGHPFGRKFKALVTHDGVFSTLNQYSSEELFFPQHDFGGTLWDNREIYEKWDPARHLKEWATPHLIIHNELDYRLPLTEGLAPFNVLQSKGIDSKLLYFSDENHWVLKPENSLVWHREVFNWINKYSSITDDEKDLEPSLGKLEV